MAVGYYHSATPDIQLRYKHKVMKLWNVEHRRAAAARRAAVIARFEARRRAARQEQDRRH